MPVSVWVCPICHEVLQDELGLIQHLKEAELDDPEIREITRAIRQTSGITKATL